MLFSRVVVIIIIRVGALLLARLISLFYHSSLSHFLWFDLIFNFSLRREVTFLIWVAGVFSFIGEKEMTHNHLLHQRLHYFLLFNYQRSCFLFFSALKSFSPSNPREESGWCPRLQVAFTGKAKSSIFFKIW